MNEAELVLGIGKELAYNSGEPPKIVGYKKKRSFKAWIDEILKDFNPKDFRLPALKGPEAQDMLEPFEIYAQSYKDGKIF